MRTLAPLAVMALVACAGCDGCGNYGPETIPKDPGTVIAAVFDQSGAGMQGVWVYVHDIPNSVGGTFSRGRSTNATGLAELIGIPAGPHRVEVKPPFGYAMPEMATVDVVKGHTVSVAFRLTVH